MISSGFWGRRWKCHAAFWDRHSIPPARHCLIRLPGFSCFTFQVLLHSGSTTHCCFVSLDTLQQFSTLRWKEAVFIPVCNRASAEGLQLTGKWWSKGESKGLQLYAFTVSHRTTDTDMQRGQGWNTAAKFPCISYCCKLFPSNQFFQTSNHVFPSVFSACFIFFPVDFHWTQFPHLGVPAWTWLGRSRHDHRPSHWSLAFETTRSGLMIWEVPPFFSF